MNVMTGMNWILLERLFWGAAAGVIYTFAGYHLLIRLLSRLRKRPAEINEAGLPKVTALVAMGNEQEHAAGRIENLLESTYANLEIVVVLDCPTDNTAGELAACIKRLDCSEAVDIHVETIATKSGKATCLNRGLLRATGEIIVFCDARQSFRPDAISHLVRHFAEPEVGAVSGELMIENASEGDMGAYWRMEKALRRHESKLSSVIGCTGAIYACRKMLIKPIPADTILDDVVIPMRCLEQGYTVKFEPEAVAYDPRPSTHESEAQRKIRTLAGNWQLMFRYPQWLLPWKSTHPLQLVSHKYLRLLGPYMLATLLICNLFLASYSVVYQGTLCLQGGFYLLATLGLLVPTAKTWIISLPGTFTYLNWLNAAALVYYLKGDYQKGWTGIEGERDSKTGDQPHLS